jgi:hypothetical protein
MHGGSGERCSQLPHVHVFAKKATTLVVKPPSPRADSRALNMGVSF